MNEFKEFKKEEKKKNILNVISMPLNFLSGLYETIYEKTKKCFNTIDNEIILTNVLVFLIIAIFLLTLLIMKFGSYSDQKLFYNFVKDNKVVYDYVDDEDISFHVISNENSNIHYNFTLDYEDEKVRVYVPVEKDLDPNGSLFYDEIYECVYPYIDDDGKLEIKNYKNKIANKDKF